MKGIIPIDKDLGDVSHGAEMALTLAALDVRLARHPDAFKDCEVELYALHVLVQELCLDEQKKIATKPDNASKGRSGLIAKGLDNALHQYANDCWFRKNAKGLPDPADPLGRAWKGEVLRRLNVKQWRTLARYLPKWGKTEEDIVQILRDWRPSPNTK
jgi:hypothetical protein